MDITHDQGVREINRADRQSSRKEHREGLQPVRSCVSRRDRMPRNTGRSCLVSSILRPGFEPRYNLDVNERLGGSRVT